jgi:nicotinamidase-related amidase
MNSKKDIKLNARYWSFNRRQDGRIDPDQFGYRYENLNLDFNQTALLIVDVYGKDSSETDNRNENTTFIPGERFLVSEKIKNDKIVPALNIAREKDLRIIYLENRYKPYLVDEKGEFGKTIQRVWGVSVMDVYKGSLDHYSKKLAPKEGEYVVKKRLPGGFLYTEMDYLLRNLGVKNLISMGFDGSICLFFTLYEAWALNYKIVLLRDATYAMEPTEESFRRMERTNNSIGIIEMFLGHSVTTQEFIESMQLF